MPPITGTTGKPIRMKMLVIAKPCVRMLGGSTSEMTA